MSKKLLTIEPLRLCKPLILLLLATACTEARDAAPEGGTPVTVSASIADGAAADLATTRSVTNIYGNSFAAGDKCYATFTGCTVDATTYTLASSGSTAITPLHQPYVRAGQTGTVRGYFPYYTQNGPHQPAVTDRTASWTVQQDQATEGYYHSDLMYAPEVTISAAGIAALTFQHRMAKIIIHTTRGTGITSITSVRLVQGYRTVNISDPATLTPGTELSDAISVDEPLLVRAGGDADGACLVPPQQIQGGLKFIEVQTPQGTAHFALTANQTTLAGGNVYTASVSVTPATIGATTTVTAWTAADMTANTDGSVQNRVFLAGNAMFQMNHVKGGEYSMTMYDGSASGNPTSTVKGKLSDYYIGQTEVTQALWRAVMGGLQDADGNAISVGGYNTVNDNYPMTNMTWSQAAQFIEAINNLLADKRPAGYVFALPSEVQWQWAAQGGTKTNGYAYAGSNTPGEVAWSKDNVDPEKIKPVAQLKANELGLYDMSGNVAEMTADTYAQHTAGQQIAAGTDYCYTSTATNVVVRGGNPYWVADPMHKVNTRHSASKTLRWNDVGIRLALVPAVNTLSYTGAEQTWTAPQDGRYLIEAYGAQGGKGSSSTIVAAGGLGGYAAITVTLTQGQKLYVYVGGKGTDGAKNDPLAGAAGGYNGGGASGKAVSTTYACTGGGGGASHVATTQLGAITTTNNLWTGSASSPTAKSGLLLVAAGGGGGGHGYAGGDGGGASGSPGRSDNGNSNWFTTNGSQAATSAGATAADNTNNKSNSCEGAAGGGAGFIGGNARQSFSTSEKENTSGCGGSSWGNTTDGTNYATYSGLRKGNGLVVITPL